MHTIDNHLAGVTMDRPHPVSYRPDLPLRSELLPDEGVQDAIDDAREEGRDAGYGAGKEDAEGDARDTLARARRLLERERDEALNENAKLRAQLAQKSA